MTGSKLVPWAAFVLGAVASIAANVAHAVERAEHGGIGGMLAAGWAPVALLLVAEMVTRTRTRGPWWAVAARWAGTLVVAGVAAVVSYKHMYGLLIGYGESTLVATLLPLSVDGLVLVASVALATPAEPPAEAAKLPVGPAETPTGVPQSHQERLRGKGWVGWAGSRPVLPLTTPTEPPENPPCDQGEEPPEEPEMAASELTDAELAERWRRLIRAGLLSADSSINTAAGALGTSWRRANRVSSLLAVEPVSAVVNA